MMHDYKYVLSRPRNKPVSRGIRWHWHGAIFFVLAALLVLFLVESQKSEASNKTSNVSDNGLTTRSQRAADPNVDEYRNDWEMETYEIPLPAAELSSNPSPETEVSSQPEWQTFVVRSGYNLAIICSRAGVKAGEVHALMQLGNSVATLKKLYPNDKIYLKISPDGSLQALRYDMRSSERLLVTRKLNRQPEQPLFKAEIIKRPLEVYTAHASGVINDSLYVAAQKAGLSVQVTSELASLFGWDIDYVQQVRKGDRFTVVYEEYYRDGEKLDNAEPGHRDSAYGQRIIAAEFINDGKVYRAVRYTDPDGNTDYYTPDGHNIRKTFMRNPVDARVSSHFNPNRLHPLLHKTRPHKGVDYAAPKGTPIHAAGDGKVIYKGRQGGYGRTIILQHGQRYSTLYAHMSGYARNTNKGRKVKQGQIIGYVGKSGLATGYHLHYEFRIDGVHHNPLTVKHPSVAPIPVKLKEDFYQKTRIKIAQLDSVKRISLASEQSFSDST